MAPLFQSRPRTLRHLLANAAGVTLVAAGVATVLLPDGPAVTDTDGAAAPVVQGRLQAPADTRLRALMRRFDCSSEGFGDRQIPRSSIIRRADGRLAVVSFDRGWKVFERDGGESLVAVCLEPVR